jgi:hypothetical protein
MGIVKLAFVTPAMIRVAIPHDVLLMNGILPFSFRRYRCETRLDHAKSTAEIFMVALKRFTSRHRAREISTGLSYGVILYHIFAHYM